ncbi:MAG: TIGR03668 family PPOX class F420-dependent oxidoreductase [Acidimicrobiales bacterium]
MDERTARARAESARVARLATMSVTGRIEQVPITFAFDPAGRLVTAIDHKPKTTTRLKRLDNVAANPEVSVVIDHYDDEDWSSLWWVRIRGLARVVEADVDDAAAAALRAGGVAALVAKYGQYRDRPPDGPAIVVEPVRWQWWAAD